MTPKLSKDSEKPRLSVENKVPNGTLIAIGGRENKGEEPDGTTGKTENLNFVKNEILERFVQELPGKDPLVLIIPTASSEPEEVGQTYLQVFRKLKVKNVQVLDIRTRLDSCLEEHLKTIDKAAGIMFTGGDQLRLTAIFGGTEIMRRIKERYYQENLVIAGTSAGAAAMSTQMIFQGMNDGGFVKGSVSITAGLEFLNDAAIDTHFNSRGRIVRMAQMIATNPTFFGIGLEKDTGVVVKKGREMEIIGSGLVVVVDGRSSTATNIYEVEEGVPVTIRDLRVHLLSKGDTYTLEIL